MGFQESCTRHVAAAPDAVFSIVTDIKRLPEWNAAIVEVVEQPERLESGAIWKVKVKALGSSWVSKSQASEIDSTARRFAYRSQTDDGNPSYTDWEWRIEPDGDGSKVTVTAEVSPQTFWRKTLLSRMRRPGLRRELPDSLQALEAIV